jgi:phage tail-like protein
VSRAGVEGLRSPHPLMEQLPAVYAGDEFALALTGALDEVLAPVLSALDNLAAYFDPMLAPEDFVDWLGGWMGLAVHARLAPDVRRRFVAEAHRLHRQRGTPGGLAALLHLVTGGRVDLWESGGSSWSRTPGAALPGDCAPTLRVRVEVPDPSRVDHAWLDDLVRAAKPAHVVHSLDIVGPTVMPAPVEPQPPAPPHDGAGRPGAGDQVVTPEAGAIPVEDSRNKRENT